jgi:UDP-N-acetylglucosamine--N-acetylmuramyl-(pentapeptide) pyrophosphoryl-undecaprenol N-acetylglucosamine transferase
MKLVIAGGGTGGHLFPGIAIAEAVMARDPSAEVLFVGTARGIESRAVPRAGFKLALIEVSGLKGASFGKTLGTMVKLPTAGFASRRILKDFGADVVIGVGGYASGPVLVAAKLMGLPTAICEQNSVPGVTNRILARVVNRIFVTFKASLPHFPADKVVLVGNPVRRSFQDAARAATAKNDDDGRVPGRIFVFGGSQGARPLNEAMPQAMALLKDKGHAISVVHQAGKDAVDGVKAAYDEAGVVADVTPFIDDMVSHYRAADVVICRAGATSCAEVTALGAAAILVPFPQAADDHQTMNAKDLVDVGAAVMLPQRDLTPAALAELVHGLLSDPVALQALREKSLAAGRLDAADVIARAAADGFRVNPPTATAGTGAMA